MGEWAAVQGGTRVSERMDDCDGCNWIERSRKGKEAKFGVGVWGARQTDRESFQASVTVTVTVTATVARTPCDVQRGARPSSSFTHLKYLPYLTAIPQVLAYYTNYKYGKVPKTGRLQHHLFPSSSSQALILAKSQTGTQPGTQPRQW